MKHRARTLLLAATTLLAALTGAGCSASFWDRFNYEGEHTEEHARPAAKASTPTPTPPNSTTPEPAPAPEPPAAQPPRQ